MFAGKVDKGIPGLRTRSNVNRSRLEGTRRGRIVESSGVPVRRNQQGVGLVEEGHLVGLKDLVVLEHLKDPENLEHLRDPGVLEDPADPGHPEDLEDPGVLEDPEDPGVLGDPGEDRVDSPDLDREVTDHQLRTTKDPPETAGDRTIRHGGALRNLTPISGRDTTTSRFSVPNGTTSPIDPKRVERFQTFR